MKVAVTGGIKGRLSGELIRRGYIDLNCDITDENSIIESLDKHSPDLIINSASYTKVDQSEKDRLLAYRVNAFGPNLLAKLFSGKIIQISTDYIFSGKLHDQMGYKEEDVPIPLSGYGNSKFWGEVGLRAFMNRVLIVRTTILYQYNKNKSNFVQAIYEQLKQGKKVKVPELYGNPTYIPHLADALESLVNRNIFLTGFLHVAGLNNLSRYDLALKVADKFNFDRRLISKGPIYGEAKREQYSGLILDKALKLGIPLYTLESGLRDFKQKVLEDV